MLPKNWKNSVLTSVLIATCYMLHATSFAVAQTDSEKISQLQQQIEALEKEAEQYRGNIADQQAKAQSLKGEITILENQIKKLQTQITVTSKNISKTGIEISGLEGNIFDTQEKINYKRSTVGRLLLSIYKLEQQSLLEILVKNQNLSDFLRQGQYNASINL